MKTQTDETLRILRIIRRRGVLTGSRKFGVDTDDSDYDYLISRKIFEGENFNDYIGSVFKYNEGSGFEDEFQGLKIFYQGKTFDILIPNSEKDWGAWEYATEQMALFPTDPISNKEDRVMLFEQLKSIYRKRNK